MDEFLKMDIFFSVSTLAVVVLTVLVAYALLRLNRILRNIEHISEQAALESENLREDLAELRADFKEGKGRIESALGFFGRVNKRHKAPR